MSITDKWEEEERLEVIGLLREQMKVEGRLVGLYENSTKELPNAPVRHILHIINLDSPARRPSDDIR